MKAKSKASPVAVASGLFLIGAILTTPTAFAAGIEEIANYKGTDRQAKLEAGAKKEGELLLYATATQIKPVIDAFRNKYPYIKTDLGRGTSTVTTRRVMEEYAAGRFIGDGLEETTGGLGALRSQGLLVPFWSPELDSFDKDAIEPNRLWVSVRESYGGMAYNSDVIKPEDAPKTWDDMLDPKYKGKMAISDSGTTKGNWAGALILTKGEDFLRKLGTQDIIRFKMTSRAVANLNATGEVAISARASNAHVTTSRKKGAPLVFVDPGPMAVSDTAVALLKNAPHPHAMLLLIDFLASKEGQEGYVKLGYASARLDVKSDIQPQKKMYLANRPNYHREFENWIKVFNASIKRVVADKKK